MAAPPGEDLTATDPYGPNDPDDPFDAFDDDEEGTTPVPSWLGAIGQMTAALLVVVGLVVVFVVAAVLRRLWP